MCDLKQDLLSQSKMSSGSFFPDCWGKKTEETPVKVSILLSVDTELFPIDKV